MKKLDRIVLSAAIILGVALGAATDVRAGGGNKKNHVGSVSSTPTAKITEIKATIVKIDADAKTLKLKALDGGTSHVIVVKDTTPILKHGIRLKFTDLKEGDIISAHVEEQEKTFYARSITVENPSPSTSTTSPTTTNSGPDKKGLK